MNQLSHFASTFGAKRGAAGKWGGGQNDIVRKNFTPSVLAVEALAIHYVGPRAVFISPVVALHAPNPDCTRRFAAPKLLADQTPPVLLCAIVVLCCRLALHGPVQRTEDGYVLTHLRIFSSFRRFDAELRGLSVAFNFVSLVL